jgi:hypothetical protein
VETKGEETETWRNQGKNEQEREKRNRKDGRKKRRHVRVVCVSASLNV